jgi:8-oxo-dGTP diphosphatase
MKRLPLVGIAVVVIRDGRVLLGKRLNAHGKGTWAFPGGHLEFNETIDACARREVWEETGLRISNLMCGPYTNDIFRLEGKHYVTLFLTAESESGTPRVREPHKCREWRWVSWPPAVRPLFLPITNLLKKGFRPPVRTTT